MIKDDFKVHDFIPGSKQKMKQFKSNLIEFLTFWLQQYFLMLRLNLILQKKKKKRKIQNILSSLGSFPIQVAAVTARHVSTAYGLTS